MARKNTEALREFKKMLPVELSEEQLLVLGNKLSYEEEGFEQHILDAKAKRAGLLETKKAITLEIQRLAKAIRDGKEEREVVCITRRGKGDLVEDVRTDTGEVIGSRKASDKENQDVIPFGSDDAADERDLAG